MGPVQLRRSWERGLIPPSPARDLLFLPPSEQTADVARADGIVSASFLLNHWSRQLQHRAGLEGTPGTASITFNHTNTKHMKSSQLWSIHSNNDDDDDDDDDLKVRKRRVGVTFLPG